MKKGENAGEAGCSLSPHFGNWGSLYAVGQPLLQQLGPSAPPLGV